MSFCRGSVNCRVSDGQMYDLCESSRSVEIFVGVGGVGVRGRQRQYHQLITRLPGMPTVTSSRPSTVVSATV